jgi:DNA-binding MarR family transcriptional regulator
VRPRTSDEDAGAAWAAMRRLVEDHQRIDEIRAAVGLGRGSGRVKALLALAERSPLTLRELADTLGVDSAYATLIVNHLEALGLVTRTPHPDDRRSKLVAPTPEGTRATLRVRAIRERPPAALAALDGAELSQLRELLERAGGQLPGSRVPNMSVRRSMS